MAVQKREFELEKNGTYRSRITFDTEDAEECARIAKEVSSGGRSEDGSVRLMGYIPPEMWAYDPWLIIARRAQKEGDMGEYTKNIKKFFEVHPSLGVPFEKKYF